MRRKSFTAKRLAFVHELTRYPYLEQLQVLTGHNEWTHWKEIRYMTFNSCSAAHPRDHILFAHKRRLSMTRQDELLKACDGMRVKQKYRIKVEYSL